METYTNQTKHVSSQTNLDISGVPFWGDAQVEWGDVLATWGGSPTTYSNTTKHISVTTNQQKN